MITFFISIILLVISYFVYGRFVESRFGADEKRKTPAIEKNDGVDFVPLKPGKIFLIQFLNIAGLGPIFGAIAGALWGPVAFIWIVVGCIFMGSVHDYFSGMLSIRHGGASIPEVVGKYLGVPAQYVMRLFAVVLLILVGVVFIKGPASILNHLSGVSTTIFIVCIFIYYLLATMIPVDKLIGKIYPVFGISLLIMAVGIFTMLIIGNYKIPEIVPANLVNMHHGSESHPIYPMLFITIACGAISGFHSTQSPLMARCLPNENMGRKIFFGAMIAEGIVALIWAAAAMAFFGGVKELNEVSLSGNNAAWIVNEICNSMLGKVGGVLALIGVVAAPITSGDTAFRSARLTVADAFKLPQGTLQKRLLVTVPLFVVGLLLTQIDFGIIWRYFGWANQTLATIVLWTAAVYMEKQEKKSWFVTWPAVFMTAVVTSYILVAPEGFAIELWKGVSIGSMAALLAFLLFMRFRWSYKDSMVLQPVKEQVSSAKKDRS
ncbi:carbon starvation protein A [Puteibacter caeruleilacunae]|nr:carbon starvation protein A [Puteibacter caeruleilacunae]